MTLWRSRSANEACAQAATVCGWSSGDCRAEQSNRGEQSEPKVFYGAFAIVFFLGGTHSHFMRVVWRILFLVSAAATSLSASDLADFGKALIKNDAYFLPEGDWGKLGKALLKNDTYFLPDGDLGKLGKALLKNDAYFLPRGDLGKLGKALLKKDAYFLPDGDLGKLGTALLKSDTYFLPN